MGSSSEAESSAIANFTSEDNDLVSAIGGDISSQFQSAVCKTGLYGAYFVIAMAALYSILKRSQKSRSTWILLSALITQFILVSLFLGAQLAQAFIEIETTLVDNLDWVVADRINFWLDTRRQLTLAAMIAFLGGDADCGPVFMINDYLAVWRALAIWNSSDHWPAVGMYFIVFANFTLWLSSQYIFVLNNYRGPGILLPIVDPRIETILSTTSSSLSCFITIVATMMVGYASYCQGLFDRKSRVRLQATGAFNLLIESGFLYSVVQISKLALMKSVKLDTPFTAPVSVANNVFQAGTLPLAAMYTPALILIITYKCSVSDTIQLNPARESPDENSRAGTHTLSALAFANSRAPDEESFFVEMIDEENTRGISEKIQRQR